MSHLTKKERKRILRFVHELIATLGLPAYDVTVSDEPAKKDCYASITWNRQRYTATLWVNKDWATYDEAQQRNTLTHEVLHLIQRRTDDVVVRARRYMHAHEFDLWRDDVFQEVELMVDLLAGYLSETAGVRHIWEITRRVTQVAS